VFHDKDHLDAGKWRYETEKGCDVNTIIEGWVTNPMKKRNKILLT